MKKWNKQIYWCEINWRMCRNRQAFRSRHQTVVTIKVDVVLPFAIKIELALMQQLTRGFVPSGKRYKFGVSYYSF